MQLLVILVPVLFGLIGFALDLGQLYLVRGELQTAANAMAIAAAGQLIGTDTATDTANTYARLTLDNTLGFANKYYYGGLQIGQSNGTLNSTAPDPSYFDTYVNATAAQGAAGGAVTGSAARYAQVTLTAETPLTFWSFLSLAQDRKVSVAAQAVAGVSAPLCVACSIEPLAVAAIDQTDTTDFGFVLGTEYTFGYMCNGAPTPGLLTNGTQRVPYLILNRLDANASVFADEQSQLYRDGAGGLPGTTNSSQSCFTINNTELIWASATPPQCAAGSPGQSIVSLICGMTARFEATYPSACAGIADIDTMSSIFVQDTDASEIADYTQYQGNGRRVMTVSVVDTLSAANAMTVLGFRQFLIEPAPNGIDVNPSDANGRFNALYIGSVVPVKQGSFSGCQQTAGPGKVVLHQ